MRHRGRDGSCTKVVDGFAVGHNLHAIGSFIEQPLVEGDTWFAGNLEIYNRKELVSKYRAEAGNDAELAFELLKRKGKKAFSLFDGPFAISFCDGERIFLARDIAGIFPLFFRTRPFGFASERKAMKNLRELNPRHVLVFEEGVMDEFNPLEWRVKEVSEEKAVAKLDRLLRKAVKKRVCSSQALLFSGGLDSSIIAFYLRELGFDGKIVSVGLKGSWDERVARESARVLGIDIEFFELTREEVLEAVPRVSRAVESSDPVKVETGTLFYLAAKKAGTKSVLLALGADELFGGYARMHRSPELETWWAFRNIYERTTYPANVSCFLAGAEARVPFLDREVVKFALSLPGRFRRGKYILRKLAEVKIGEEIADLPKKAAQYSSGVSRAIPEPKSRYLAKFWPKNKKVVALLSGGKDSWYALHIMHRLNYEIVCAAAIKPEREDSWLFHVPFVELVKKQAKLAGIPLIFERSSGDKEREMEDLKRALRRARDEFNAELVVSGAISSQYQRERIERVSEELGMACYAPLWGVDQESYLRNLVKEGFRFIIVSVSAEGLGEEWIGKKVGPAEVEELIRLARRHGFNPAGEGGEYETLVVEAPLFRERLEVSF